MTLAELLEDPARAIERTLSAPEDAVLRLLTEVVKHETLVACIREVLTSRLVAPAVPGASGTDRLVAVDEAAGLLGMTPDYIYRHKRDLGFVVQPSPGQVRCSIRGIERFIASRTVR